MRSFAPSLLSALTLSVTMSAAAPVMAQQAAPATTVTSLLKQVLANAKERGHLVDEGVFRVKAPRHEAAWLVTLFSSATCEMRMLTRSNGSVMPGSQA